MKLPHVLLAIVLVAAVVGCSHASRVEVLGEEDAAKVETALIGGIRTAGATHAMGGNWAAATKAARWQTALAGESAIDKVVEQATRIAQVQTAIAGGDALGLEDERPSMPVIVQIEALVQRIGDFVRSAKAWWHEFTMTPEERAERDRRQREQEEERRQQELRDRILGRAREWIDAGVSYNQRDSRDEYRTDCSGYVSMAWELPNDWGGPTTGRFVPGGYAIKIAKDDLLPGDAINNEVDGNCGHVVLFVEWLDEEQIRFRAYDNNGKNGASENILHFETMGANWTIREYEHDPVCLAKGPFFPMRRSPEYVPGRLASEPSASFHEDVTIPDNTVLGPGEAFEKKWDLVSDGTAPWPVGTELVFVSGSQMEAPNAVIVVPVRPGEHAIIAVPMVAPLEPGTYKGVWQLRTPSGIELGPLVYVLIEVQ